MAIANLAARFIVELIGVGALAYWGYMTASPSLGLGRVAVAIGAALALIVLWALVVAPNAGNALSQPQRDLIGTILLLVAAAALAAAGQPTVAMVFGAVVVLNWILTVAFGQEAVAALRSIGGPRRQGPGGPA